MSQPHRSPYDDGAEMSERFDPRASQSGWPFPITALISAGLIVVIATLIGLAYRQAERDPDEKSPVAHRPTPLAGPAGSGSNVEDRNSSAQRRQVVVVMRPASPEAGPAHPSGSGAEIASAPKKNKNLADMKHVRDSGPVVQVGAFGSRALADAGWTRAVRAVPARGAARGKRVEAVRRGDETFYRSAVTGFDNDRAATGFCLALRKTGGDCFVRAQ